VEIKGSVPFSGAVAIYDEVTAGRRRWLRVDELCAAAALAAPGRLPDAAALAAEARRPLRDKTGIERALGAFLHQVLADPVAGRHLCHAMLLPQPGAVALLPRLEREGRLEFTGARLERAGRVSVVTMCNPPHLNAEDETTLGGFEQAIDLALLDPVTELCVLRGAPVAQPKYAGRRLFGAGINLTHLWQGRIPYLWYLLRDLGPVNKLYRGLALPDADPEASSIEKPWLAVVDGFAIGGHCQLLLVMDQVLAADDAWLSLPARKEGIIPGAANLRLPRHVGPRLARQAILAGRRIDCASPAGQLVCDYVVPAAQLDLELERLVGLLTGSGLVSAAANRRALRIGEEPLDRFRRYMAVYAREQADCHLSPALVANLGRHWPAAQR